MAGHIILLGDSIFDNAAYVGGAPDVARQLRGILPEGWRATLLAVDGAVTGSIQRQLAAIPANATLLVVSAGGNDALGESGILSQRAATVGDGVMLLAEAQLRFEERYGAMLEAVMAQGVPTALCTIYDANFSEPEGRVITAALALFNDVITRAAFSRGLALIDLRLICGEPSDYANRIEPSEQGGAKIARAIAGLATGSVAGSQVIAA
ncbi:MAG TPA: GDSL-type esterase/lipase family protein [Sphingomicrobium sp.]|nr:GDSL-type esterase/lipase family protein [Sphingomicrobium sp.]